MLYKQLYILVTILTPLQCYAPPKTNILSLDQDGYTSLHRAAINNDVPTIVALAKAYPQEIDRTSETQKEKMYYDTAAHLAAYHKKWDALRMLIALGAQESRINIKHDRNRLQKVIAQGLALRLQLLPKSSETQTESVQKVQISTLAQTEAPKAISQEIQTYAPPQYDELLQTFNPGNNPLYSPSQRPQHQGPPPPYQLPAPMSPAFLHALADQARQQPAHRSPPLNPQARTYQPQLLPASPSGWTVRAGN